jgi:hypothetical protein
MKQTFQVVFTVWWLTTEFVLNRKLMFKVFGWNYPKISNFQLLGNIWLSLVDNDVTLAQIHLLSYLMKYP